MLAGVPPSRHRVTFNDWREGAAYFSGKTIFSEVTRAGGHVALLVHKQKLLMFAPPRSVARAEVLSYPRLKQGDVVAYAVRYFQQYRPTLLFVHVADPDDAGHRYGWMTPEYLNVIANVPALIAQFLRTFDEAGVTNQAMLLVTADHGGHGRTHGTGLPEDMAIPWGWYSGAGCGRVRSLSGPSPRTIRPQLYWRRWGGQRNRVPVRTFQASSWPHYL